MKTTQIIFLIIVVLAFITAIVTKDKGVFVLAIFLLGIFVMNNVYIQKEDEEDDEEPPPTQFNPI